MKITGTARGRWLLAFTLTFVFTHWFSLPASAQSTADPNIGKQLYRSYCFICHGKKGDSKGPLAKKLGLTPANLTSDKYQKKGIDEMAKIIGGYGRAEGDVMPTWRNALPESNIKHIAAYLAIINSTNLKFIGDTRRGRLIFRSACMACHGPSGKGNGILAKIIGAPMVDFTKADSTVQRYSDKALIVIIKNGKQKFMPGWEGTLNNNEIIDVAAHVRSLAE